MEVKGRMVIDYCMERLMACDAVDGIWVVAAEDWHYQIMEAAPAEGAILGFSKPGASRTGSILNGMRDLSKYCGAQDVVIVHDAARPMVGRNLLERCIEACADADGVMPVLPMKDTV